MDATIGELLAEAARDLRRPDNTDDLLELAVEVARREIDACDGAAVSIVQRRRHVDTPASTGAAVLHADELQYELGEGPCLDAIWEHRTVHSPDVRNDDRWPTWGPEMVARFGYRSMAAFQLFTHDDNLGALNLYSEQLDAFTPASLDLGYALAAHVAVALSSTRKIDQLDDALASRTSIGTAIGIVMERYRLTPDQAFAVLTRASSTAGLKLRDVAADVVAGGGVLGEVLETDPGAPSE